MLQLNRVTTLQKNAYSRTFMNKNNFELIGKVFLLSAIISILIKYSDQFLSIPATATAALIMVLLPTILMATILLWRKQKVVKRI